MNGAQPAGPNILSGIKVAEIPAARPPEIPETVKGVVITEIDPDSPIGKTPGSLQTGDVIEEIDHQPVASVADFEQIAKRLPPNAQQTLFLLFRGGAHSYVVVATPSP
jgi:serine protease Do